MASPPCRVLVVDDHKDYTDSAVMLLRMVGHEVHAAYSPAEALTKAKDHQPDVVIMDVALPGKTGYDLGKEIRQFCPSCRIVAVTGFSREDIRQACESAGFNGHLLKPVDPVVMNDVVDEQCRAARVGLLQ